MYIGTILKPSQWNQFNKVLVANNLKDVINSMLATLDIFWLEPWGWPIFWMIRWINIIFRQRRMVTSVKPLLPWHSKNIVTNMGFLKVGKIE